MPRRPRHGTTRPTHPADPLLRFAEAATTLGISLEEQAGFLGLPQSSYLRILEAEEISPGVATLAERLPRACEHLPELFGNEEDVRNRLLYPNLALGRERPLDLLRGPRGYEEVLKAAKRGTYRVYQTAL